jgi:quercetin dioxygenase-like cupin family protein
MSDGKAQGKELEAPAPLGSLVDYQEGSVVSRTLVKNRSGSVTLFAFDRGQAISEHTVPYEALVMVLDGSGEFTVGGKHVVTTGSVLLMPASVPHAVTAPSRFKMALTMLKEDSGDRS